MRLRVCSMLVAVLVFSLLAGRTYASVIINLGTADPFAVLGEAGVTNAGPSMIYGSLAGSTGTPAVTGFPPGQVVAPGVLYPAGVANSGPGTPFGDAAAAYGDGLGLGATSLGTASLGAGGIPSLAPGVYSFSSSTVLLSGLLQLDAGGSNTAQWVFQIPYALTTVGASSVVVTNAGDNGAFGGAITWLVGSDATIGTTTTFLGTIISMAGDQVQNGASVGCGRVISLDASVTLDTNVIDAQAADCLVTGATGGTGGTIGGTPSTPAGVPELGTFALLLPGLLAMVFLTFRKPRVSSLL